MSSERKFWISGVNIVTHPHSPERYVKLLRLLLAQGHHVPVRGVQHLMIGELRSLHSNNPVRGLQGRLYRFIHIDKDAGWFNIKRNDVATEQELEAVSFPDHLRPNTETYDFVFYPHGHTLYINTRSSMAVHGRYSTLSVGQVVKFLKVLCSLPEVTREFGDVEITALPDREQFERILALPKLRHLVIEVVKPNPEQLSEAETEVFSRLSKMKTRKIKQELIAEKHESIVVDSETRTLAQVGAANGQVIGYGHAMDGQPVRASTVDKPWRDQVAYNPEVQTEVDALHAATSTLPGHDTTPR
ncbi:MAG: DUF4747 family protein [Burkholderiaceae bacterium]|jgi:hypothetical protein|nr:DUF4747 family protein [Burkholderiaceae bacterium]